MTTYVREKWANSSIDSGRVMEAVVRAVYKIKRRGALIPPLQNIVVGHHSFIDLTTFKVWLEITMIGFLIYFLKWFFSEIFSKFRYTQVSLM